MGVDDVGGSKVAETEPFPRLVAGPFVALDELLFRLVAPVLAEEDAELLRIVWWLLYGLKLLL